MGSSFGAVGCDSGVMLGTVSSSRAARGAAFSSFSSEAGSGRLGSAAVGSGNQLAGGCR